MFIYSNTEVPDYLKIISMQMQTKGFTYTLYNDINKFNVEILEHLKKSEDCVCKFCAKSLLIELDNISKDTICEILKKISNFEKDKTKKIKKILFRWDKIDNDDFNNNFDYWDKIIIKI